MEESPIFTRTYDLLLWLLPATQKFPKEHRFVLAKKIQESAFELQDALLAAGLGYEKPHHLQEADVALRRLQLYIRLSHDLKFIWRRLILPIFSGIRACALCRWLEMLYIYGCKPRQNRREARSRPGYPSPRPFAEHPFGAPL